MEQDGRKTAELAVKQFLNHQLARELLEYALAHPAFQHTVHTNDVREIMIDAARSKGPKTGAQNVPASPAYVRVNVDDRIVIALKGPPEQSPYLFMMVAIPTQALELLLHLRNSNGSDLTHAQDPTSRR